MNDFGDIVFIVGCFVGTGMICTCR